MQYSISYKKALGLWALAVCSAIFWYAIFAPAHPPTLEEKLANDYAGIGDGYIATALQLLQNGTFMSPTDPYYFGAVPSGPAYQVVVAIALFLFGKHLLSIYIMQALLFGCAVVFLYGVSMRYLSGWYAVAPSLMLASFWGASTYVFQFNNEIVTLFCITGFLYGLVRYEESMRVRYLVFAVGLFSTIILMKPIFEYFFIVIFFVILVSLYNRGERKTLLTHGAIALAVYLLLVGTWHVRNYQVFGTFSISTGGHALYLHAVSATYPLETKKGFLISAFAGDYIADFFVPGYSKAPEPATSIRRIFNKERMELKMQGVSEFALDAWYWKEARRIAEDHPVAYLATVPAWFFRLNSMPYYNGGMIDHMFVGTYESVPWYGKVIGILLLRIVWYVMTLGIALYAIRSLFSGAISYPLILGVLFMVYVNGMYALFAHAEVRYMFPAMPLYFLWGSIYLTHHGRTIST